MVISKNDFKTAGRAPIALVRPIFVASADIGPVYCWICPHGGQLEVRTEPLEGFPRLETDHAGRRTLLTLGRPIWLPKYLLAGYPDVDALPDALFDVLEAIYDQDVLAEGNRHRWLASPPVSEYAV